MSDNSESLKIEGNEAFGGGRFEEAKQRYTKALEAPGAAAVGEHVLYSNRSAANLGLGLHAEALADATVAVKLKPDWAKAYSRKGAVQMKLRDYAGACETFRRAYELEGREDTAGSLVEALLCSFRGVRLTSARQLAPGQAYKPGDWAADIDPGAHAQLVACAHLQGAKWDLVRMAAVLQLAGLARCPQHKARLFKEGGAVDALCRWGTQENIRRLALPPRMAAVWKYHTGVGYEDSSLLLPAATGLYNLTKLGSCTPELPLGLLMCHHGAGVPSAPGILRTLNSLATRAASCRASLSAAASCYQCIVPAIETQQSLDIFLAACGQEAMEKLALAFEEEDLPAEHRTMLAVAQIIFKHPYHRDNQVPGKALRDDYDDYND